MFLSCYTKSVEIIFVVVLGNLPKSNFCSLDVNVILHTQIYLQKKSFVVEWKLMLWKFVSIACDGGLFLEILTVRNLGRKQPWNIQLSFLKQG